MYLLNSTMSCSSNKLWRNNGSTTLVVTYRKNIKTCHEKSLILLFTLMFLQDIISFICNLCFRPDFLFLASRLHCILEMLNNILDKIMKTKNLNFVDNSKNSSEKIKYNPKISPTSMDIHSGKLPFIPE